MSLGSDVLQDTYHGLDVCGFIEKLENGGLDESGLVRCAARCITGLMTDILAGIKRDVNWPLLVSVLQRLEGHPGVLHQLSSSPSLKHYVPRILQQVTASSADGLTAVSSAFPSLVAEGTHFQPTAKPAKHSQISCLETSGSELSQACLERAVNTFESDMKRVGLLKNPPPSVPTTLGDIQKMLPSVIQDGVTVGMRGSQREEVLSRLAPMVAIAATAASQKADSPTKMRTEQEELEEILQLTSLPLAGVSHSLYTQTERSQPIAEPPAIANAVTVNKLAVKTGMEKAKEFLSGKLDNSVKLVYLHLTPSHLYRPYDLHVIPQEKAGDAFYIMSRYSIVYCNSRGDSDTDHLRDWYWEAMMFELVSSLPFFKLFLARKAFARWRVSRKRTVFRRRCEEFAAMPLKASPFLLTALCDVNTLLLRVSELNLISVQRQEISHDVAHVVRHIVSNFSKVADTMSSFFRDGKLLLEEIVNSLNKCITVVEEQNADQPYFSQKPMMEVRKLKHQSEAKLKCAERDLGNVQRLILVVDQMVLSQMLSLARDSARFYVNNFTSQVGRQEACPLIKAKFMISEKGSVCVVPSVAEISDTITSGLRQVVLLLCRQAPAKNIFSASAYNCRDSQHGGDLALMDYLMQDDELSLQRTMLNIVLDYVSSEVETFLDDHDWFEEVTKSVMNWTNEKQETSHTSDPSAVLSLLKRIDEWLCYLKAVPQQLQVENCILQVDCSALTSHLLPRTQAMQVHLTCGLMTVIESLGAGLVEQLDTLAKPLLAKSSYVEGFAKFATAVTYARQRKAELQASKCRFEAFQEAYVYTCQRQSRAQGSGVSDTMNCDQKNSDVQEAWRHFMYRLQDAEAFVRAQGPRTESSLYTTITCLEEDARSLIQYVNSGMFVSPKSPTSDVLSNGRMVHEQLKVWRDQYVDTTKWLKTVSGKQHDLALVQSVYDAIIARTDLWQLVGRSTATVEQWTLMAVQQVNIQSIGDLLEKWIGASSVLEDHLPDGDPVLAEWKENMQKWLEIMNVIQVVFAPYFQVRHWKSLYSHLNLEYDSGHGYTLADVVALGLLQHRDVLASVVASAQNEFELQLTLEKLQSFWEQKQLQFVDHHPKKLHFADTVLKRNGSSPNASSHLPSAAVEPTDASKTSKSKSELLIIAGIGDLIETLEEHTVLLQRMLQSQYILDLKSHAKRWISLLQHLRELLEMWSTCQNNWMYLSEILFDCAATHHLGLMDEAEHFQVLHVKLMQLMLSMKEDAHVMSLLGGRQNRPGNLCGEEFRLYLLGILKDQEDILKCLEEFLEEIRRQFPRLYFVDNSTVLDMILHAQHPPSLLHHVRCCYPELRGIEMKDMQPSPELTAAMTKYGLPWSVTSVQGLGGEDLLLCPPLLTSSMPQQWMNALGVAMRHSLTIACHQCLQQLITIEASVPMPSGGRGSTLTSAAAGTEAQVLAPACGGGRDLTLDQWKQWSSQWPLQCLLVSYSVFQTNLIRTALEEVESASHTALSHCLSEVMRCQDTLLTVLTDLSGNSTVIQQHQLKVSAMISGVLFYRDIVSELVTEDTISPNDYNWLQHLQFNADPYPHVCSKSVASQATPGSSDGNDCSEVGHSVQPCRISAVHLGSRFAYGYEFYSAVSAQLPAPPLTVLGSRYVITVLHAMRDFSAPLLFGEHQCGKSTTVKQLSQMLARQLVMLDCAHAPAQQLLSQYIRGSIQSGAVLCLEHFHSLPMETLVIVAEWLKEISNAFRVLPSMNTYRNSPATTEPTPTNDMLNSSSVAFATSSPVSGCNDMIATVPQAYPHGSLLSIGQVTFDGILLNASSGYAPVMTWTGHLSDRQLPTIAQAATRPICLCLPERSTVIDIQLCSAGYVCHYQLSKWFSQFMEHMSDTLTQQHSGVLNPSMLHHILQCAMGKKRKCLGSRDIHSDTDTGFVLEKRLLQSAIVTCLQPSLDEHQLATMQRVLLSLKLAPQHLDLTSVESTLLNKELECKAVLSAEINICLDESRLQTCSGRFVEKALELYDLLKNYGSVLLLGSAGNGKTQLIEVLEKSLNSYHSSQRDSGTVKSSRQSRMSRMSRLSRFNSRLGSRRGNSHAYSRLGALPGDEDLIVRSTVFPRANSNQHFFGCCSSRSKPSQVGHLKTLLTKYGISKKRHEQCQGSGAQSDGTLSISSVGKHWIVLDGHLDAPFLESLATTVDTWRSFSGPMPQKTRVDGNVRLLLESDDTTVLSPATVSQFALLNVHDGVVPWQAVCESWIIQTAATFSLPEKSVDYISSQLKSVLPRSLAVAHRLSSVSSPVNFAMSKNCLERHLVTQILTVLHALLHRHNAHDHSDHANSGHADGAASLSTAAPTSSSNTPTIEVSDTSSVSSTTVTGDASDRVFLHLMVYAVTWGIAGSLDDRQLQTFSTLMMTVFKQTSVHLTMPVSGFLIDFCLDKSGKRFLPLVDSQLELHGSAPPTYHPLPEVLRYSVLMDYLIDAHHPVLLTGQRGVGKTSLMKYAVSSQHTHFRVPMSSNMNGSDLQQILEERHTLMRGPDSALGKLATTSAREYIVFLDDIHLVEGYDKHTPLLSQRSGSELLRQVLETRQVYDENGYIPTPLTGLLLIASLNSTCQLQMSSRLLRHWVVLNVPALSDDGIRSAVTPWMSSWLEEFPAYSVGNIPALTESLVQATVRIHRKVVQSILPDPLQAHCLFDQRHIFQVMSGLQLVSPSTRPRHFQRRKPVVMWKSDRGGQAAHPGPGEGQGGGGAGQVNQATRRHGGAGQGNQTTRRRAAQSRPADLTMAISESAPPAVTPPMLRTVVRLWCHEVTCTYMDAFNSPDKVSWFSSFLHSTVQVLFCGATDGDAVACEPTSRSAHRLSQDQADKTSDSSSSVAASRRTNRAVSRRTTANESSRASLSSSQAKRKGTGSRRGGKSSGTISSLSRMRSSQASPATEEVDEFEAALQEAEGMADTIGQGGLVCVSPESILRRGEDLAGLAFTKHLVPGEEFCRQNSNKFGAPKKWPYVECGSGELEQALKYVLGEYNSQEHHCKLDLVLFPRFVDHLVKQCRLLAFPRHHSLLIGPQGCGRSTVLKIAAFACTRKLIELCPPRRPPGIREEDLSGKHLGSMYESLRQVIELAGVQQCQVLLVVRGGWTVKAWVALATFMAEGICPGVFSSADLLAAAFRRSPSAQRAAVGVHQTYRTDLADKAVDDLVKSVRDNVHVAICMTDDREDLCRLTTAVPQLVQSSVTIHCYSGWSQADCTEVATHILEQHIRPSIDFSSAGPLPVYSVSNLMASIHCHMRQQMETLPWIQSKLTARLFLDVAHVFGYVLKLLLKKDTDRLEELSAGLDIVMSAQEAAGGLHTQHQQHSAALVASIRELKKMEGILAKMKRQYYDSLDKCQAEESEIDAQLKPLEQMMAAASEECEKIQPLYAQAVQALAALPKQDIDEIRSYTSPPLLTSLVTEAVCVLFNTEPSWQSAKKLFNTDGFFSNLENFDKDNISNAKVRQIRHYTRNPKFDEEIVAWSSKAVRSLCVWVKALVRYSEVSNAAKPQQERLHEAEKRLRKAKVKLDEKRIAAGVLRKDIKKKMEIYDEYAAESKRLEKLVQALDEELQIGSSTLSSLQTDYEEWNEEKDAVLQRVESAPGDALMCAAATCYGLLVPADRRAKSLDMWHAMCKDAGLTVTEQFSLSTALSTPEEQSLWFSSDMPTFSQAVKTVILLRCAFRGFQHQWPILVDPDDQAIEWLIKSQRLSSTPDSPACLPGGQSLCQHACLPLPLGLQYDLGSSPPGTRKLLVVNATAPDLLAHVRQAARMGDLILIDRIECAQHRDVVHHLLQRVYVMKNGVRCLSVGDEVVECHASFVLVARTCLPFDQAVVSSSCATPAIGRSDSLTGAYADLCLSKHSLCALMTQGILREQVPTYRGHIQLLEAELHATKQSALLAQRALLQHMKSAEGGRTFLCNRETLSVRSEQTSRLQALQECMGNQMAAQRQEIEKFPIYHDIARHAAIMYTGIQQFVKYYPAFHLPLSVFQHWLLCDVHELHGRFPESMLAHDAQVSYVLDSLTQLLKSKCMQGSAPPQRLILLLFLVMPLRRELSYTSDAEWSAFTSDLIPGATAVSCDRPAWLNEQAWQRCAALQNVGCFTNLCAELSGADSTTWEEFFEAAPSLIEQPTVNNTQLTLFQTILLWKAVVPNQLSVLVEGLVDIHLCDTSADPHQTLGFAHFNHQLPSSRPVLLLFPDPDSSGIFSLTEELHLAAEATAKYSAASTSGSTNTSGTNTSTSNTSGSTGHVPRLLLFSLTSIEQQVESVTAMSQALEQGDWIVYTDAWCATAVWTQDVMDAIMTVLASGSQANLLSVLQMERTEEPYLLHPSFRIIIPVPNITDFLRTLPVMLLHHSTKACLELQASIHATYAENLARAKTMLKEDITLKTTEVPGTAVASGWQMPSKVLQHIALLHSAVEWRSKCADLLFKKAYSWSYSELQQVIVLALSALNSCDKSERVEVGQKTLGRVLVDFIYCSRVLDRGDRTAIAAIGAACWKLWCGGLSHSAGAGAAGSLKIDVNDKQAMECNGLDPVAHGNMDRVLSTVHQLECGRMLASRSRLLLAEILKLAPRNSQVNQVPLTVDRVSIVSRHLEQLMKNLQRIYQFNAHVKSESIPEWLAVECHLYSVNVCELFSKDIKPLHSALKGSQPWKPGSTLLLKTILCGGIPSAWRQRFPQVAASNVSAWIEGISIVKKELDLLLSHHSTDADGGENQLERLPARMPLRLAALFQPAALLRSLQRQAIALAQLSPTDDVEWTAKLCTREGKDGTKSESLTSITLLNASLQGCANEGGVRPSSARECVVEVAEKPLPHHPGLQLLLELQPVPAMGGGGNRRPAVIDLRCARWDERCEKVVPDRIANVCPLALGGGEVELLLSPNNVHFLLQ